MNTKADGRGFEVHLKGFGFVWHAAWIIVSRSLNILLSKYLPHTQGILHSCTQPNMSY